MNSFEEQDFSSEKFSAGIWKKILKLVIKRTKPLIFLIIFVIGLAVLDILYPLLNKYAIEEFFTKQNFTNIKLFIGAYCLIAIGYGVVVHGFIKMAGLVEVEVGYELRHEAFVKLQLLPFSYYDKTPAGWIMARLTSDSRRLAGIISWGIVDMLWGSLTMVGILVLMYFVNWKLALIITFLLPILVVVSIYFRKKILISYRGVRKTNSKITASYNEGILGSKTTKTLVLEEDRNREFNELCNKMRKDSIKAIAYSSLFFPILLVISYIAVAITLRAGGYLIIVEGVIGISTLYFFISCTTQFFDPIMQIARILAEFQQAQASAERILSLIETKPDIFDSQEVEEKYGTLLEPKTENWEELKGKVVFEQVTFQYQGGEKVLEDFNLTVPEGTSVALVGETGAGKSTIVNLVCRFYEPTAGKILIDDVDYKERSLAWLHNNLGYVLQTPHLFNGTIMENIRYGRLDATDDEVKEAAKAVSADEFIVGFEKGYDTNVGEGGTKLSVGQRQLISFARALLANPRILILDEATSSIDTKTEELIQGIINRLLKGRTSFVVAHRLSTIIAADMILVIKDGKIIEQGTHEELLALKKEYFELYRNQFINEQIEKSKYA
ncbi:MAG TPA: ABC transporter ATP-binding protein [Bacilli bacterium]|jgi:ATP-binding cassette subfamily B protein|nr:ABC transporter ATP-binding protein [Acholeplasmataceae bacterium]HNZ78276.1 ABC transporter ATP-binding protein [Bacilli bacterium]HOD61910.1 ABC transporter ATP-binding protein [Bacilli bacterium]HOH62294.1 ABC transporter ATP-binding protein [Bacilli bacterium]HPB49547.1 ABC transporter ATP-binding protein [Bacilli bacterium]